MALTLRQRIANLLNPQSEARSYGLDWYFNQLGAAGSEWPWPLRQTLVYERREDPDPNYSGYSGVLQRNGVVWACIMLRQQAFAEAVFKFRELRSGRPGKLFGTVDLEILEHPWPGGTTGDLLGRALLDVDLAGNSFWAKRGRRLHRLRPDWVTIVIGSHRDPDVKAWDFDADVLGYIYRPGGPGRSEPEEVFLTEEVAHFAPYPDPSSPYRGMTWLAPLVPEIRADDAATIHKARFFENGATVNLVVTLDPAIRGEAFQKWVDTFEKGHKGAKNAYKTLYLGAGAKVDAVGSNFEQLQFKATQGAGETRIASAAGVPPVLLGLSEGLQAATYNNAPAARRRFGDLTLRPLWRNICGSFETIIPPPSGSQLWFDDRDIAFLREDVKDSAEINQVHAATIVSLANGGFEPKTAIDAVTSGDMTRLVHTGLLSVQLQPPGEEEPEPEIVVKEVPQLPATTEKPAIAEKAAPTTGELRDLRCTCGRLAGRVSGRAEIKCRWCNALVVA